MYRFVEALSDTLHSHVKYDLGRQTYPPSSQYCDTTLKGDRTFASPRDKKLHSTSLDLRLLQCPAQPLCLHINFPVVAVAYIELACTWPFDSVCS